MGASTSKAIEKKKSTKLVTGNSSIFGRSPHHALPQSRTKNN
jgi:hypothetical protein